MQFQLPINTEKLLNLYRAYLDSSENDEKRQEREDQHWESLIFKANLDGFIEYECHQNKTQRWYTGRPNIQGIPKACRPSVQYPNHYIVWADWSASHPNLLSKIAKDKAMIEDLKGDIYGVFPNYDRKLVKLALLLTLNGAGIPMVANTCNISQIDAKRLMNTMKKRWEKAFATIKEWCDSAKKNPILSVGKYTIDMGKESPHKAPAFVLQHIESKHLERVCSTKIKGATVIAPIHDEIVWMVEKDHIDTALVEIQKAMEIYGKAKIGYGSAWMVDDKQPCGEYKNDPKLKQRVYYGVYPTKAINEKDLVQGKYLKEDTIQIEKEHKTVFLKAPKGAGKTTVFQKAMKEIGGGFSNRIVSVVPIRTLAREQAKKLPLPHYKDRDGDIDGSSVVVINSIRRVNDRKRPIDILFLDEITSTLSSINHSGTISEKDVVDIFKHFSMLIQNAKVVVCADADLNENAITFVRNLRKGIKEETICVETDRQDTRALYADKKLLQQKILEDIGAGKRIYICSTSKNECKVMHDLILSQYPDKKGILIHSTSEDREETVSKLNDIIDTEKPDFLVCSPSVQSGVSIDTPYYFDYCVGFYHARSFSAPVFDQMVARVRKPKENTVHVWLDKREYQMETSARRILAELYTKEKKNAQYMGICARTETVESLVYLNEKYQYVEDQPSIMYNEHYARMVAWENSKGSANATQGYLLYCICNCVDFVWIEDKKDLTNIKNLIKDSRDRIKEDDNSKIMGAEDISLDFAKSLMGTEPSPTQQDMITKAFIQDTYGDVNSDTIKEYDKGNGRKKIKNMCNLFESLYSKSAENDTYIKYDHKQRENKVAVSILKNKTLKVITLAKVLIGAGIVNEQSFVFDTINIDTLHRVIQNNLHEIRLSYNFSDTVANQPMRVLSQMLESVGLTVKANKVKRNGKTIREYTLDLQRFEFVIGTPYFLQLWESVLQNANNVDNDYNDDLYYGGV
jgi:hypothetical protein